jgi:16S rRNA (guanine966-N2)-methyltransferase
MAQSFTVCEERRMRITGGRHRSRMLVAPKGSATRPTSDRVREALFAILASAGHPPLAGVRVLDLYAGTGALALEALVERAREALDAIRTNVAALHLEAHVRVLPMPVDRAVRSLRAAGAPGFDLVFADPPYADVPRGDVARALEAVVASGALAEVARVVVEHGKGDAAPPVVGLVLEETRRYGDTCLSFYMHGEEKSGARVDVDDVKGTPDADDERSADDASGWPSR